MSTKSVKGRNYKEKMPSKYFEERNFIREERDFVHFKQIDFHHMCNLFLVANDKSISKHQNIPNAII